MKQDLTIKDLQKRIKNISHKNRTSEEYMLKLMEEVGELAEDVRKNKRMEKGKSIKDSIEEELNDVLYYVVCLANFYNIDLEECIYLKEEINCVKHNRKICLNDVFYKRGINMEYTFRDCTLEDFDFLFDLKKQNFKWYVDKIWGWIDDEQKKRLEDDLKNHLSHKKIIIIEGKKAGVYASHITENGDFFINEISLLKEYQGKSIGKRILEKQLKQNKEKKIRTILQVFKDNPAKRLYERLGFKIYGETETHYQMEVV